ncbi:MAG: hypothetical protein DMD67_08280 [Gemmatimonadetes bacterium]|nr:MAG: hypothetical protein DMD67_08280 [Gemmatimonadota bacterium]
MTSRIALDLVSDGAVRLVLDRPLYSLAERWIPQGLREPAGVPARATISVCGGQAPLGAPAERATVSLDRVAAWVDDAHATAVLRGAIPSSGGVLSFAARHARLQVDPARAQEAAADLYSLLTVAAALLLADLGRALVHAAAVVAPDGGAWLLAGDARSGKSTTCATLAAAGWGYLSDDQVVLAPREDGVEVEGWLRPFHLDSTGEDGEPTGERRTVPIAELGLAGWRRTARLAGLIRWCGNRPGCSHPVARGPPASHCSATLRRVVRSTSGSVATRFAIRRGSRRASGRLRFRRTAARCN